MELDINKPTIETSSDFESSFFGVSDLSIIFDILRNKMYSSPIKAICREVTCNARDAHREVGTPKIPIDISLPTALSSFLKIKDYGPGISPDRMSNVFINYAASTKRNDNTQTGGFGLGAKTPFSYSDTFNIITVHGGTKYSYSCFIDETRLGKLVQLSKEPTDEPSGTEIIVPVKRHDAKSFEEEIINATSFWDVRPNITNKAIEFHDHVKILEGGCWSIIDANYYSGGKIIAIVDGIQYPIDIYNIETNSIVNNVRSSFNHSICIYFDVGELVLSANREQIYIDDKQNKSKSCIQKKLDTVEYEIKESIETKIKGSKTWWEACVAFNIIAKKSNGIYVDVVPKWNGKEIIAKNIKGIYVYSYHINDNDDIKKLKASDIYNSANRYFSFKNNECLFVFCHEPRNITKSHALKIFKQNPGVKSLQIVIVKDTADKEKIKELKENLNSENIEKYFKTLNKNSAKKSQPLRIYRYDSCLKKFLTSSLEEFKKSKCEKVLCTIPNKNIKGFYNESPLDFVLINGCKIGCSIINTVSEHFTTNLDFFAVKEDASKDKVEKNFKGLKTLDVLVKEYLKDVKINFAKVKSVKPSRWHSSLISEILKDTSFIKYKKSKIITFAKSYNEQIRLQNNSKLLPIYEAIYGTISDSEVKKNKAKNLSFDERSLYREYPLLENVSISYYRCDDLIRNIRSYINLIDKEKKSCRMKK